MTLYKNSIYLLFIVTCNTLFAQLPCSSGFIANGTDDFVPIPDTEFINTNTTAVANRTIEFWFKTSDITTKQVLYEEGGGTHAIVLFLEGDRVYSSHYIFANNATTYQTIYFRSGTGDISIDTWHHIALTLASGTTSKWYLDGVEQDSKSSFAVNRHTGNVNMGRSDGTLRYPDLVNGWTASTGGSAPFSESYTGALTSTNSNFIYSGYISMFRIWNVARTASEIDTNKSVQLTSGTSLVAYQNGDIIYYMATGDTGDPTTIIAANNNGTSYTWTGVTSTTFTDDLNWSATSPDVTKTQSVVINSGAFNPSITTDVQIGDLTVDSGAELTIQSGATLSVYYDLTNNGTITVEDGGSLIYHSCTNAITNTGTFNVKRTTPTYVGNDFYSYWSSPVIAADSNIAAVFSDAELIYNFNAIAPNSDWALHGFTDFAAGVGYAVQNEGTGGQIRNFSGTINEGEVSVAVYDTSNLTGTDNVGTAWSTSGDNLVGNPYATAIDWDLVIIDEDNADIQGTMYLWSQLNSEVGENNVAEYLEYNLTGGVSNTTTNVIGSSQGFFIKTTATSTIKFKPTHKMVGSNTTFYKGLSSNNISDKENGRSWFTFNHKNKTNTFLIGFLDGASNDFDRLYDAPFDINQTSMGIYSFVEQTTDKASIQGLPKLSSEEKTIKLGYIVDEVGEYSIAIQEEHINQDYYIYLLDSENETTTNLRKQDYDFTISSVGENNSRFKIIYSKNSSKETLEIESYSFNEEDLEIFNVHINEGNNLVINYKNINNSIEKISLFTIHGKEIAVFKENNTKDISKLSTGIYIVNATLQDKKILTKKIFIKN